SPGWLSDRRRPQPLLSSVSWCYRPPRRVAAPGGLDDTIVTELGQRIVVQPEQLAIDAVVVMADVGAGPHHPAGGRRQTRYHTPHRQVTDVLGGDIDDRLPGRVMLILVDVGHAVDQGC